MKTKCGQLYMVISAESSLPKFKVGDMVRISKYKSAFTKGYEANFTEELFKVIKVICGYPNVYEIEDLEGELIIGKFYEEELSDVYRVKGKKMVLVKWLGYGSKHNSWIPESNIQDIVEPVVLYIINS